MKKEMEKVYNPQECEDHIYQKWENSGYFNPDNLALSDDAPNYTIILPPPNITAKLHIGHSAMLALEDLMIRYHRMNGYRTLWLPGTDHAAIATQNVVEKELFKSTGKTRHDLGKEVFLSKVWEFVNKTQATILSQTKKMGSSLDWSRLAFTLDEERQQAVRKMFIDMYQDGVIYRGERIVNWCPRCHSTLSDDEVEYHEQEAKLYTFKYSVDFPFAISTTRPETKLGDTAVAVNPKDERYQKYLGKEFSVDFCGQKLKLKIIGDRKVEMDFGTGALGVTPAHSMVDWQMAQDQGLETVKVIDENGKIKENFGEYSGLSALEARAKIVEKLQTSGLMIEEKIFSNNLSSCYRCDSPIEPLLSKQWFIGVDRPVARFDGQTLKEKAIAAYKGKDIEFLPDRFGKSFESWMSNLRDWCISRQIWFGHEIPVWYRGEEIFVGESVPQGDGWLQDGDTLDTWFSSGMWTFSTLGWPNNFQEGKKIGDLKRFHPTQVLETGYEILTLWVSRMVMMSLFAINEIPFEKVYLHGTILDSKGKKMSKSKGNGVDPIDVINIYGADALRLSLLTGSTPGNDSRYSEEKVAAKRNFINKLWNISRFILSDLSEETSSCDLDSLPEPKTLADRWIMAELHQTANLVREKLDDFNFSLAAEELSNFTWNKLADWYLEIAKVEKGKEEILAHLLKSILVLWHPFIPYVTEEIWSQFNNDLLIVKQWPGTFGRKDDEAVRDYSLIQDIIIGVRNGRSENRVEPARKVKALIFNNNHSSLINSQLEIIKNLKTGISEIEVAEKTEQPKESIAIIVGGVEIYLLGAVDQEKEKMRLHKERENLEKMISLLSGRLANEEFVAKAPAALVEKEQTRLLAMREELKKMLNH
ncbi:MAG: valine--tRNA ligase [Candidatus Falkowbacteria bacterium]|nr:valine--tRNA ligase [Candidatus Falkowbacteria bacterium]